MQDPKKIKEALSRDRQKNNSEEYPNNGYIPDFEKIKREQRMTKKDIEFFIFINLKLIKDLCVILNH